MNPYEAQQQANAQERAARYIQQDPEAARLIASRALKSQKTVLNLPYWSTVRFLAPRTGSGPYVFTMATGVRKAFATGVGQDGAVAGFASGTIMTEAETNLGDANATRNGETVEIHGICAEIDPTASPTLVKHVMRNVALSLAIGGDTAPPLGRLSFFPQAGGLHGVGNDPLMTPGLTDNGFVHGALANGAPFATNFFKLGVPIVWQGANKGTDTAFNILCDLKRSLAVTVTERAAAAGTTTAFTAIADGAVGSYVDVTFRLVGMRIGDRSSNV